MTRPSQLVASRLLFALMSALSFCSLSPALAQEPGFAQATGDASPSPGFEQSALDFEVDALRVKNARLDLEDDKDVSYLKKTHGLTLSEGKAIAFKGVFTVSDAESSGPQLLVLDTAKDQLKLYEGTSLRMRYKDVGLVDREEARSLGLPARALIVQTTQDNMMDLLIWQKQATKKGRTTYRMSVVKVFGDYFGRPFSHEIAKQKKDGDVVITASVSVYEKKNNLAFGVTRREKGAEEIVYLWDKWSGTFANPALLPKAKKKTRS